MLGAASASAPLQRQEPAQGPLLGPRTGARFDPIEADEVAAFKRALSQAGAPGPAHELRRVEAFPGTLERAVASEARWNDLFLATCPRDEDTTRWRSVFGGVSRMYCVLRETGSA